MISGRPAALLSRIPATRALLWLAALAIGVSGGLTGAHAEEQIGDVFSAVVSLRADIPSDARTAETLGTEREGTGVVIDDDGLILTIGYLILEAINVEVTDIGGQTTPADIIAYDYDTGFGLVRALQPLTAKPIRIGRSSDIATDDRVLVLSQGGAETAQGVIVVERRTFAGYWEYLLENAIFTSPPHYEYGGAALIGADGTLLGIGSLLVGDVYGRQQGLPGNMFVPIDALKPILADLMTEGRSAAAPKPWLGVFTEEDRGRVFVTRVADGGPAEKAGIAPDDIIIRVGDEPVTTMSEFFLAVWDRGEAGVDVPLTILHGAEVRQISVESRDRYKWLRLGTTF